MTPTHQTTTAPAIDTALSARADALPAAGPNYAAVFGAVLPATAASATVTRPAVSQALADFIDACDTAVVVAFDDPAAADWLPGVDVPRPASVLKAYLLFLAQERCLPAELDAAAFERWYQRVPADVWQLLEFHRPPVKLKLSLAFSLIGQPQHQAPQLRGLIWLLGDLAACGLLPGVRA